jgi:glycosyltransferase involved in cell wall biosynthesis
VAPPRVSAIIPTYQRPADLRLALASVVAQTYPAEALEIIVVDDGSADDGAARVCAELGERVRYLKKPNGGVSAARNHGMAAATGAYLALLDDDDEWRPTKIARQVELLTRRPGDGHGDHRRRAHGRATGSASRSSGAASSSRSTAGCLPHVLRNPALAPASAMLRREVFTATGGFDTTLRTAEDLDFHLRVAARFQIAVIAEPLTRAMRGHQGLSALARTNRDYLDAIERFVDTHAAQIAPPDRAAALFWAYLRNVRGALTVGTLSDAARLTVQAARFARTPAEARELARTGALVSKNAVVRVRRALGGR